MIRRPPRSTLFPTRRSSDLPPPTAAVPTSASATRSLRPADGSPTTTHPRPPQWTTTRPDADGRSEEHTSELQSRQYLVCRLLLEKKKKYLDIFEDYETAIET